MRTTELLSSGYEPTATTQADVASNLVCGCSSLPSLVSHHCGWLGVELRFPLLFLPLNVYDVVQTLYGELLGSVVLYCKGVAL